MSLNKSTILKSFNTHFFELLDDMITVFPSNIDIQNAKKAMELIKKANPIILIRVWNNRIRIPYASEIEQGDITFFFEKDYSEDIVSGNASNVLSIIDNIREPIRSMDSKSREDTMGYIKNLSQLASMYYV
jgi:hypothetical protein